MKYSRLLLSLVLPAALLASAPAPSLAADANTWVDGGEVTSGVGNRTRNNVEEKHPGIDIVRKRGGNPQSGVPVKAGCKGTVVKVYKFEGKHTARKNALTNLNGWLRNLNLVVVKCSEGEFAGKFIVFAHMQEISVKEGASVQPGTQVGKIGGFGEQSANTFSPHVHIEVRDMDPDNPQTPANEGDWDSADERRVATGDYTGAHNPLGTPTKKKNGSAQGQRQQVTPNQLRFDYTITNNLDSELPIDFFRVRFEASSPYLVVDAPIGWSFLTSSESPHAVTWFATDPAFGVQPGTSLAGFAFTAANVATHNVRFSFGDDAGGGPLVGHPALVTGAGR
jgi:murein DD-endopeptidase MepM/ murein hydrolase activator NlpD